MILSDRDIKARITKGDIVVTSPDNKHLPNVGASSMDLRLGRFFKIYDHTKFAVLDPLQPETFKNIARLIEVDDERVPFIVQPGEFVLGVTLEKIKISDDIVARVEGRSSLGRLGIIIHSTAGSVQPGYAGQLTLEIANISKVPVKLWPGSRICQLTFEQLSSDCENAYNERKSKYMEQSGPQMSKIGLD